MHARPLLILIAILFGAVFSSQHTHAGLSGENVALIVNASSVDSLTIANHYVSLREIPAGNVILLDDVPSGLTISLDVFRDRILRPILKTLDQRGLAPQIQLIAYSAGFPTSVSIGSHTRKLTDEAQKKYQKPTASINSLTYFYRWVLSDSHLYLGWASNFYARGRFERHFINPFGGEPGESFQSASDAAKAEDFAKAAEKFESLSNEYPTLHPLSILAAENWLRAGNEAKAFEQIGEAVRHGWINRRQLTETDPLRQMFSPDEGELSPARKRLLDRLQDVPVAWQGPIAFSSSVGWTTNGHPASAKRGAMTYMLSCVLAVIHKNGSTLPQAIEVLERAAKADRSYPSATFGFSKTSDVRSTTRFGGTPDAIAWLLSRDQNVEIFSSSLPKDRRRYVGMMLGAATLPLSSRNWSFVRGALAENLTSLGGVFGSRSQTKLTEILHAGAAISSGAVAEPYSLQPKFPTAMIYPFYYEGVSAIEAFYLTLQSPYQMLIVGDPVCQPFARAPNDFVSIKANDVAETTANVEANAPDKGSTNTPAVTVRWQTLPDTPMSTPTKEMEIYIEGKLANRSRPLADARLNLPENLRGAIDFRIVLIGNHPTEPKISFREEVVFGDSDRLPRLERLRKDKHDELTLFVESPDAEKIDIVHLGRVVANVDSAAGRIELTPETVGRGTVRLRAIAHQNGQQIPGRTFEFEWE
ncbi:hypothetical protein [Rhodopirellula sallentina]|uniref:hypothetical protein n=1 Tax=Rhodopirellula sallentina TaxID=1263869 RepID=UPI000346A4DC|nr:hypothetical protein [Rhodopirellula sallentina]